MRLHLPPGPLSAEINLPISKSISNRYLIISALAKSKMTLSGELPEDVKVLQSALNTDSPEVNIGMAGTAMRFLTAYYSIQNGKAVVLTGAERMKKRPIGELVDTLRLLGADMEYVEEEGFPPIKIVGKNLGGGEVIISASVSSQFISALMMIGPMMENGLHIHLKGKVLSKPYIELTAHCMHNCGAEVRVEENSISIKSGVYTIPQLEIESDWSSASYFYALAAARPNSKFLLIGLQPDSRQGDAVLAEWFAEIGVSSTQKENAVEIHSREEGKLPCEINFEDNPDLAQTFAFLAAVLGQPLKLKGLDNLRLKETNRVKAMKTELEKLGVSVTVQGNTMQVSGSISAEQANVKTYNDHRMAMSGAILFAKIPTEIENPEVVSKSFPGFWGSLTTLNSVS